MLEQGQFWRNKDLRKHVAIIDGKVAPTIVLKNGTYLNVFTDEWVTANIWIYHERIVYVGDEMPKLLDDTEIVNCTGQYLVPGYIEPHAHPYQLFNPESLVQHVGKFGTTTLINDNLRLLTLYDKKKAFSIIENFQKIPVSMLWWARFDSQSMLRNEEAIFNTNDILSWLSHPAIVQGGELTSWPRLIDGDDRLLYWIQEAKRIHKRVEGHFPGASEKTLTKLQLLGVNGDHESMNGEDVLKRLQLGYHAALRHSSIRPDLENILQQLLEKGLKNFDALFFTTDGSTPSYMEYGMMNICIDIALKQGIPIIDAYKMASFNIAKYYRMDETFGSITPGRLAHINILYEETDPTPLSVLAKGTWLVKDGKEIEQATQIPWEQYETDKPFLKMELTEEDLQFSIPVGLKLINNVITNPYAVGIDITGAQLPINTADAFLVLLDRHGKWRVNSVIHGFTEKLGGLCSSYSTTNDILLIGKKKIDMKLAFDRMQEIGGGIVLAHDGEIIFELPLTIEGVMSVEKMEKVIQADKTLTKLLQEAGFPYDDPVFTLFFLSSTHLPYIRITPEGIIDVIKRDIIVPANMR